MKIRLGFVSNSSSSSFCVVGLELNKDSYLSDFDNLDETIYDYFDDTPIEVYSETTNYYDSYIIGESIFHMKDEQTLLEFKKQIFEDIKKYYPNPQDINLEDIKIYSDSTL